MDSSSSSSEDDEATRAFAEVALQAELGLASGLGSRRPPARSQPTTATSGRNHKIAEALDRIICETLAFENARVNEVATPGERAIAPEDVGEKGLETRGKVAEDLGGVRLFRKGPTVSKIYQRSKRGKEASRRRNAIVPSRLPERRLVDLEAVFGSEDVASLRGIVVSGQPLVEALELLKPGSSGRHAQSRIDRATEIGVVCRPPKRTARPYTRKG